MSDAHSVVTFFATAILCTKMYCYTTACHIVVLPHIMHIHHATAAALLGQEIFVAGGQS